jgi:enamine deaminase RidA (YjgF/YER057c/UK114 family)
MKKVIHTDDAPKAIGTYSQAVLADKFLFIFSLQFTAGTVWS